MALKPIKIDFTNVKDPSQFNTKHIDPGEYVGRIKGVEEVLAKDETSMWVFAISLDDVPGAVYPYYIKHIFSGDKSQAWKVRQLANACGVTIAKKALSVNPEKFIGKALGVTIEEDEYQGKLKGTIGRLIPVAEVAGPQETVDDDDDDDEEVTPPPRKKASKKKAPEPEPADDEDDDDFDLDEL